MTVLLSFFAFLGLFKSFFDYIENKKLRLMIESARQKNSAPIAKRVSGDGAFLSIQFIYFLVEFILQNVPIRRRDSADDL